jgi:hypothetical protein
MASRFDVTSAVSVLDHITDPLVKPCGVMAVIVRHFTHLNAAVSKAAAPNATPPFHALLFRERNLKEILERVGKFE